jgi:hypothetical protein
MNYSNLATDLEEFNFLSYEGKGGGFGFDCLFGDLEGNGSGRGFGNNDGGGWFDFEWEYESGSGCGFGYGYLILELAMVLELYPEDESDES